MLSWLKRAIVPDDEFMTQARKDQILADYPGCEEGMMQCRSFCECIFTKQRLERWVVARAAFLRKKAGCPHELTRDFRPSMFPEIVTGLQCCDCGAVKKTNSEKWERGN